MAIINNPLAIVPNGVNLYDIYNHGNIVGLNPCFLLDCRGSNSWSMTDEKITMNKTSNQELYFREVIPNGKYKYLCLDCEVINGTQGRWNYSYVQLMNKSELLRTDASGSGTTVGIPTLTLTCCDGNSNYEGIVNNYNLSRRIVRWDISNANAPFYIRWHNIDNQTNIYGIWLE